MSVLDDYRHLLAEEAAGRSNRFALILRWFKWFWWVCIAAAIVFMAYGFWVGANLTDPSASMALLIFPFGALVLIVGGYFPYGLAKLFLSVGTKHG